MAAGNVGDIIIKGGSVEIMFDEQIFPSQGGKYGNKEKEIARVEVTDDITGRSQSVNVRPSGSAPLRLAPPKNNRGKRGRHRPHPGNARTNFAQ